MSDSTVEMLKFSVLPGPAFLAAFGCSLDSATSPMIPAHSRNTVRRGVPRELQRTCCGRCRVIAIELGQVPRIERQRRDVALPLRDLEKNNHIQNEPVVSLDGVDSLDFQGDKQSFAGRT